MSIKILKALYIVQEQVKKNGSYHKRTLVRLNPYNPLTYIAILIGFIMSFILFGIVGTCKNVDFKNSFKYS